MFKAVCNSFQIIVKNGGYLAPFIMERKADVNKRNVKKEITIFSSSEEGINNVISIF